MSLQGRSITTSVTSTLTIAITSNIAITVASTIVLLVLIQFPLLLPSSNTTAITVTYFFALASTIRN